MLAIAADLGCSVAAPQRLSKTGSVEAELRPDRSRNRFAIRVDPRPKRGWRNTPESILPALARHRFRFRVCHELGHTFFYERQTGKGPRRKQPVGVEEEMWCDDFARSLLVPRQAAAAASVDADSPFALQAQFDVSLEVAARAFVRVHRKVDAAVWFWPAGSDANPSSLLQQWSSLPVPSLRSWREASVVAEAMGDGRAGGDVDDLRCRGRRVYAFARCDVERHQLLVVIQR